MSQSEPPELTVALVGWNSGKDLGACLASLDMQIGPPPYEVIVVDNNSGDDTLADLARNRPEVRVVANQHNVGFGTAHNQAARLARGEWLLILNPDTVLPLHALRRLFDARGRDALVAPRLQFPDGTLQRSAHRNWPSWWSHAYLYNVFIAFTLKKLLAGYNPTLYTTEAHEIALSPKHVMGAVMLLHRDRFLSLGGFDEQYFLYLEETDFCRRFIDHGGEIRFRPEIRVTHTLGGSSGMGQLGQGSRHFMDSSYRYLRGRYGPRRVRLIFRATVAMLQLNMPLLAILQLVSSDSRVGLTAEFNRKSLAWHRSQYRSTCA
jgi:N-acetylglucosaminyl-diphospho-decaprenol L-rhamnosyltransferase